MFKLVHEFGVEERDNAHQGDNWAKKDWYVFITELQNRVDVRFWAGSSRGRLGQHNLLDQKNICLIVLLTISIRFGQLHWRSIRKLTQFGVLRNGSVFHERQEGVYENSWIIFHFHCNHF